MKKKALIICMLFISCAAWLLWPVSCIVLENLQTQKVIYIQPMQPEDELSIGWVHSVELLPWEEIFKIKDGELYMDRTRFKSFGAGVPSVTAGKSKMEEGWVVYYDLRQHMPELVYSISKRGRHVLRYRGQTIDLHKVLPDATPVRVSARVLNRFSLLQLFFLPKL